MATLRRALFEHRVRALRARLQSLSAPAVGALLVTACVLASGCVGAEPSRPATRGTAGLHEVKRGTEPALVPSPASAQPALPANSTVALSATVASSNAHAESTPSNGASSNLPPDDTSSFQAFRVALSDKNFAAARRWLSTNTVPLDASIQALADSVVALGLNQPEHALDSLRGIDPKLPLPAEWVRDLTARGYSGSGDYLSHLPKLKQSDSFANTFAVATRLLADAQLRDCEVFVNRAFGLADSFHTRGQVRLLRAQLRLAQNRPAQADPDLRWLALSNPHHPDSESAFTLLSRPPFLPLSADDQYLRANQLADHGLVEATDLIADALGQATTDRVKLADLQYLRGLSRYRRRQFAEAIPPLDRAVQMGSHKADHARYLAARATARAGNPQAAIERFKPIARSTPTTKTVTNAAFHIAREHSIAGNWEQAVQAYGEFQARFPSHEYAKLVEQDLLPVWFAAGHYKRVVYWSQKLRENDPERADGSLLRSVEALALSRLGHTDLAKQIWLGLAQTAPLSFAGVVARSRLAALGTDFKPPFAEPKPETTRAFIPLPEVVTQLDALGFSRQAEFALQRQEASLVRTFAPNSDAALCDAYAALRGGRRRFELGYEAVKRRGFKDAPQLAHPWLWNCYYPMPYADSVLRHTQTHPVSQALVYAVMRQESAFAETVVSYAGAHGLMQVIDPTARRIAAELNRPYALEDLNDPDHNIEFGVFYLNKLQNYFAHPVLIAAAYNAGPEATARWFAAGRALPLEVFVLRIPYEETRTYVQRVLANLVVYQALTPETPRLEIALEFSNDINATPNQNLPDALHATPEDFY